MAELNKSINDSTLKEMFFRDFLWNLKIFQNVSIEIIEDYFRFICTFYNINPSFYIKLFDINNIIEFLVKYSKIQNKIILKTLKFLFFLD